MDANEFVLPVSDVLERAAIGVVLRGERPAVEWLVSRVDENEYGNALRVGIWRAVRQAWKVEKRWRSSKAILFAVTRSRAWKAIPLYERKWAELFLCINEIASCSNLPWIVERLKKLAALRARIKLAESELTRAEEKLSMLQKVGIQETKGIEYV